MKPFRLYLGSGVALLLALLMGSGDVQAAPMGIGVQVTRCPQGGSVTAKGSFDPQAGSVDMLVTAQACGAHGQQLNGSVTLTGAIARQTAGSPIYQLNNLVYAYNVTTSDRYGTVGHVCNSVRNGVLDARSRTFYGTITMGPCQDVVSNWRPLQEADLSLLDADIAAVLVRAAGRGRP